MQVFFSLPPHKNCRTHVSFVVVVVVVVVGGGVKLHDLTERIQYTYDLGKKMAIAFGSFLALIGVIAGASLLGVLYYGATLVIDGEMTPGSLTSFIL